MVARTRRQDAMRPKYFAVAKPVAIAANLILLSGCANPYLQQFREEFGWTEARMVSDGWLKGREIATKDPYCYETLGDVDCYSQLREGQNYRLVNKPETGNF